jgi:photosystem II stability/assembly factor-like uncharacterized protein
MGAVQFRSPTAGVGITAQWIPCFARGKDGTELGFRRQAVRLATTSDGGRSWQITGAPLPVGPAPSQGTAGELIVALGTSARAVVGTGRLVATHDDGAHWHVQALPRPVIEVAVGDGGVWAVSCPRHRTPSSPLGCRPELWRTRGFDGRWDRVAVPPIIVQGQFGVRFAMTRDDIALTVLRAGDLPTGEVLLSHDAGVHWMVRRIPDWAHHTCDEPAGLAAAAPHTFWVLCLGGAAAGSSTKGLLRSTDGGRTWRTVSDAPRLTQRPRPDAIPLQEPSALAAGSAARLWLSLTNGLAESNDAGRHWRDVAPGLDTGGWPTVISVLDPRHAWVLAPGAGLWATANGLRWHADRPLSNG